MQTSQIEKKLCQVHKSEIVVVDLKPQTRLEDKYLCTRCLAEKVDKENLTLLQDTIEMIQSMKNQSQKLNKEENTIRLTNIKSLQSAIKSFKDYIKTELNKLLQLIDQQIEQIQTEIESKETKEEIKNFDDELIILSKNYNGNYSFNIPTEQSLKEKDIVLVQLIQESLLAQSKSQHFKEIMESIEKIKFTTPNNQQMNINQMPTKEFEQHKTPCLNQICSKHNKEIIMLNLNLNEPEFSRLACVECIEDCPIQYISLKEANKRWNEFKGQQTDLISKHNFKREKTFNVAIKEIKQLRDYYNDQLSEILTSINEQLIQNTQDIKDFINLENKQIFELEEKQIEKIVDLLSQKDKNKHLLEEQEKQERLDYLFYQNIKQKLDCLIKHDLLCKQQLIKLMQQQQDLQQSERNDSQINKKSPEIHEFIFKCQLQNSYISIFNESVDLQMELQKEANNLQQQGQLEQLTQFESDNNNENAQFSQMQQQYKQFEINSEKMRKLIQAEENYEQLKIIKQQKEDLQQQIEDEKLVFKQIQQKITCLEENMTTSIQVLNQQVSKQEQQQQEFLLQINQEIVTNNKLKENLQELSNSSEQKIQQLAIKYDDLNKQIDEAQQDIYGMKNSTILQDKLQQLENSIDTKQKIIHEKIEELSGIIEKKETEQYSKLQQEKQELLKKINEEKIETNSQIEQQNNTFKQIIKENKEEFTKQEKQISSVAQSIKEENQANFQLKKEIKEVGDQSQKGISQLAIKIDNQSKELIKINSVLEYLSTEKILLYHVQNRNRLESSKQYLKSKFVNFENVFVHFENVLQPKLLRGDYWIKLFYILQDITKKIIKGSVEMYLGSRDGLKAEYFWQKVNNKDNLLMIFKSKSGSIFGAYSPCKWDSSKNTFIADNTLTSFIFSQTHDQIYNLKEDKKDRAIYCKSDFGPSYGNYNDIYIKGDFTDGCSSLGSDYEFDRDKNKNYNTHLYGQAKPEIQECEIYQIQFN